MELNFSDHTVLVTGGTGFIGSHLVEELLLHKNRVISTYQLMDSRSYFHQHHLENSSILVQGDVKNLSFIINLVTKFHVEYIFHLAAQALVDVAYDNPVETFETNINGTISVLESARIYPFVKAVIIASSDKAYGKSKNKKYIETDPLQGNHPYEVSKSAADLISSTYWKTYHTPIVISRFGNVYGEGDLNFSRIIPGIMHSIVTNTPLIIRSDGTYIREYVYVKDVINGYIAAAQISDRIKGEAFNFGSPQKLTVLELITLCEKILHKKIHYKVINTAKNEIPYQSLNFNKAKSLLHWKPEHTLEETLPSILSYYTKIYEM